MRADASSGAASGHFGAGGDTILRGQQSRAVLGSHRADTAGGDLCPWRAARSGSGAACSARIVTSGFLIYDAILGFSPQRESSLDAAGSADRDCAAALEPAGRLGREF